MDWMEAEELAVAVLGISEDSDSNAIEQVLCDRFDVSFESFHKIAEALMPFTTPAQAALTGEAFHGFIKDDAFICKQLVTP